MHASCAFLIKYYMARQRTVKEPITINGIGLQTGGKVMITLKPAPVDSGISFVRVDLPGRPALNLGSIILGGADSPMRRTTLGLGPLQIQTTEHLLASFSGLGIDNVIIELDGVEMPGMDGSAIEFVKALQKAGLAEQDTEKKYITVKEPLWCRSNDSVLVALPCDDFKVSYTLAYPQIGTQYVSFNINEESFINDIAPARTFCSEAEALQLIKAGLGKGASYENTIVMGDGGPIQNKLRFIDEPARHKVLDLIGDLYLTGIAIKAHFIAVKSGHKLNMEMVKKLKEA